MKNAIKLSEVLLPNGKYNVKLYYANLEGKEYRSLEISSSDVQYWAAFVMRNLEIDNQDSPYGRIVFYDFKEDKVVKETRPDNFNVGCVALKNATHKQVEQFSKALTRAIKKTSKTKEIELIISVN